MSEGDTSGSEGFVPRVPVLSGEPSDYGSPWVPREHQELPIGLDTETAPAFEGSGEFEELDRLPSGIGDVQDPRDIPASSKDRVSFPGWRPPTPSNRVGDGHFLVEDRPGRRQALDHDIVQHTRMTRSRPLHP